MGDSSPRQQMKAYRIHKDSKEISLDTIPVPSIGPQDVLIKVKAVGLAPGVFTLLDMGSLSHLPATLGHEIAGVVEEVGADVTKVAVGARVRVHPSMSCQHCRYCRNNLDQMCPEAGIMGFQYFGRPGRSQLFEQYRDGGLAEYMRAPSWLVDELPTNVSFEVGAKIVELATAYRTLRVAELVPGSTVIITAPTGAVGTSMVKLAPFFGIARLVLVGRSTQRLEDVKKLSTVPCTIVGYDQLPEKWEATQGLAQKLQELLPAGADALIDLIGSGMSGFQALRGLAVNGTFVHLGANSTVLPLPLVAIMVQCWRIVGTRHHSRSDVDFIMSHLRDGSLDVDALVTHRFGFDKAEEAIARLRDRSLPIWFVVVEV